jgi:tRNA (guanine26-N2/guanine27-N2)-dimethyltransferase
MALDRDLAVAFVRAWPWAAPGRRTGWEMMAATGARGLRIAVEAGPFASFTLTEANPEAADVLIENARSIPAARAFAWDAHRVPEGTPFDYVDLDPYGTPAPFVAIALSAVRPGGILAVTATDMMVLAGVQPGACERRYGARPIRGRLGPEGGLRILLAFLAREARQQGRSVRSVLSYVHDHHVRAIVEVGESGPSEDPIDRISPSAWSGPDVGPGPHGPLWLGPLFDPTVVRALRPPPHAAEPREARLFLARVQEEVEADVPFYYESNVLAASLRLARPPPLTEMLDGVRACGYRAARTHARPEGFRSDAPRTEVERIARELGGSGQSQNARVRA